VTCATQPLEMLHRFYDACSAAVWERDGIVNKFIGDAVLAIFGFPIVREDHARQAGLLSHLDPAGAGLDNHGAVFEGPAAL